MKYSIEEVADLMAQHEYNQKMQKKVLVVDDNASFLKFIQGALSSPDISLSSANNPFDAIKLFIETHPSYVFLDINLPGISGMTLLKMLRLVNTFNSEFILLSANESYIKDLSRDRQMDNIVFLNKPISIVQLQDVINKPKGKSWAA